MRQLRELGDRLEHAGLVVRVHHRDQGGVAVDRVASLLDAGPAIRIDADAGDPPPVPLEPRTWVRRRRVLDDRGHDVASIVASLGHASDGEVVRLGAAGGEDHLVLVTAEERRDLLARSRDRVSSAPAVDVPARGVAEVLAQVREHRVDDLRQDGRRRVVVEVDRIAGAHDVFSGLSAAIARNAAPGARTRVRNGSNRAMARAVSWRASSKSTPASCHGSVTVPWREPITTGTGHMRVECAGARHFAAARPPLRLGRRGRAAAARLTCPSVQEMPRAGRACSGVDHDFRPGARTVSQAT